MPDAELVKLLGEGAFFVWAVWRGAQAIERIALSAEKIALSAERLSMKKED